MISSVQDYTVSHYFNPDEKLRFFIPKYQREYVWKQSHWDALFTDLEDASEGHFLGSIICVNAQKDTMSGSRLELIDGQQRFTTISLLFCAMYAKLNDAAEKDDDLIVELANLRNRIFVKSLDNAWRFEPSEQGFNKADFQRVLSDIFPKLVKPPKGLTYFGNRRIARAYYFFTGKLKDLSLAQAMELLNKLKSAVLVKIEVPSHSDAFVLFETINNRGIPLSAIDIIKNNLLAELDKVKGYGIDRAFDEWKDLVERLADPAVQERFLRQVYNMFRYIKRVDVKGFTRATRSNLLPIYDALLRRKPVWFFQQLQVQGRAYSALLDPAAAKAEWSETAGTALQDLQRLGAAPAYAFLLWAIQMAEFKEWDKGALLTQLANLLTKWFFWRTLTDVPATRELDPIFIELGGELLGLIGSKEVTDVAGFVQKTRESLLKHLASDELCDQKLNADLYVDNYVVTRFMLCKLEESHQTRETTRNLWEYDKDHPVFTVEHILPKTEKMEKDWLDMLAAGDEQQAEEIRQRCAHRLGNLTLSGYNSRLGKMGFIKKRDRKNEKDDLIGYQNGLYLNSELAKRDDWNEAAIMTRSERLLKEVKSMLSLREDK